MAWVDFLLFSSIVYYLVHCRLTKMPLFDYNMPLGSAES